MKKIEVIENLNKAFVAGTFVNCGCSENSKSVAIPYYAESVLPSIAEAVGILESGKSPIVKLYNLITKAIENADVNNVIDGNITIKKDLNLYVNTWIIGALKSALSLFEAEYKEIKGTNVWTIKDGDDRKVIWTGSDKTSALKQVKETADANVGKGFWLYRNDEAFKYETTIDPTPHIERLKARRAEMKKASTVCPICASEIVGHPATSRFDNHTDVCSYCGTLEALSAPTVNEAKEKKYTFEKYACIFRIRSGMSLVAIKTREAIRAHGGK